MGQAPRKFFWHQGRIAQSHTWQVGPGQFSGQVRTLLFAAAAPLAVHRIQLLLESWGCLDCINRSFVARQVGPQGVRLWGGGFGGSPIGCCAPRPRSGGLALLLPVALCGICMQACVIATAPQHCIHNGQPLN